ncbi:MAG: efflux RND transporter permease subunit [Rikenellaceae bacterium]
MEKFFISRPIFAIAIAIATALIGAISLLTLSVEQYPDITPPVVEVTATYYGADAQTVNSAVATPIAESIMGIENLLYMQSTSANDGTMTLQAVFNIGTDPDMNAILTQNRASTASSELPESVIEQGVVTSKFMPSFLMVYSISSDRYSDSFITNYADINMKDELLKISGVGDVMVMGAGEYAMRVWVDPEQMSYYGVSLDEIASAMEAQGGVYPSGKFGAPPVGNEVIYSYTVTLPAQISTAEEFENIILRSSPESGTIRIRDVARVDLGNESYTVKSRLGSTPAAMMVIYQSTGSNAVEVGDKVRKRIAELTKRLPDGVECQLVVDSTQSIEAGIDDIFRTLLIALLLVIFIIYIFLQDLRATLIPLIAIPVSLLGAFILFPLLGFSINIISLLGLVLAIGLVVDDAIVVVEAVQLNISKGMTPTDAAVEAMRSVTSPIIATTVVLLAVFIPVSFIPSLTGLLFRQFAVVLAVSVVISAINALTLSPALCAMLLRRREEPTSGFFFRFNRWFDSVMGDYTRHVGALSRHSSRTAIFVLSLLILIALSWRYIPQGFLPEEDQGYVMVMVETPPNTALDRTLTSMEQIAAVIATNRDVESVSYAAGYNMIAGITSSNSGIIFVELTGYSDRKATAAQIATTLNGELYFAVPEAMAYAFIPPAIPGLGLTSGVTFEVQDLASRGGDYLWAQTEVLIDSLRQSPLVENVTTQYQSGIAQRELVVDKEHAESLGIDLSELYSLLGGMLGGTYVNNFNRFGRLYDTYIEAAPEFRANEEALQRIYITNDQGVSIPISTVVAVKQTTGVEYVSQFNLYRSISITLTPKQRVSSADAMALVTEMSNTTLPPDIGIAWSGVSYEEAQASAEGSVVYLLAVIFVFLALSALYNSWGLPFSILLGVPIAVVGALCFIAVAHAHNPLFVNDVYMQISLVMLIGLAAKNAILVVEYADRIFFEGDKPLLDSAIEGARLRVRPIIMTAFAFILGVMPLVFASGVYSTARNIMGVALVGGVLFATVFGVFLYPALYILVGKVGNFEGKRRAINRAKQGAMGVMIFAALLTQFGCAPTLESTTLTPPAEWITECNTTTQERPQRWWEEFQDTTLNGLIGKALTNNRDLIAAVARLESSREAVRIARSEYLPSLSFDVTAEQERYVWEGKLNEYIVSPTVSWEVPLFGALKSTTRKSRAEILASVWALRGVELSLVCDVATNYFNLREAEANYDIALRSAELRGEEAALIDSMARYGLSSGVDLDQARSLLYSAQSDVVAFRREAELYKFSLSTLLGVMPSRELVATGGGSEELIGSAIPIEIPETLPSELLESRWDVQQSWQELEAAAAAVGVARAARFPSLSLSAAGGVAAETIKGLTSSDPWGWSLAAELAQPIYNFGALKSRERAARNEYRASLMEYEQTMLQAISETEQAMVSVESYAQERACAERLVAANRAIRASVGALYDSGMNDYLNVIDAERELYTSQQSLIESITAQRLSYITLQKTLGSF